jgi:hypothetical protein
MRTLCLVISALVSVYGASQNATCPDVCRNHACNACLPSNFVCTGDITQTQCLAHPDWCWCGGTNYDCDVRNYQCVPSAGGTFPSVAACSASCGITCPSYSQKIGGYCYAVMDKTPKATQPNRTACATFPNCTQDCQIDFIQMPPGWELAPRPSGEVASAMYSGGPVPNSTQPAATYAWGCDYLWYDGNSFSATWNPGGPYGPPAPKTVIVEGSNYKVSTCGQIDNNGNKIVMRIPAISSSLQYF